MAVSIINIIRSWVLFLIILASCRSCSGTDADDLYGTGITLSRDYGTISVYFANRTSIDVAKIQGGHLYRAYMKDQFDHKEVASSITTPWYCPFPQSICKYWPPQDVESHNALQPMLKALLASAETVLEKDVTSVMVSTHVTQNQDHWVALSTQMSRALEDMKVDRWGRGLAKVTPSLALQLNLEGDCDKEEERVFMAIEYTRESLVGQIWNGVCGVYERPQTVSSSSSGHDAISACREESQNAEQCNAPLRTVIRRLIETSGHPKYPLELSALFIFGERADDENFLKVLVKSLEDSHVNATSIDTSLLRGVSPDLTFAGSRAIAEIELSGKEYRRDHRTEL